MRKTKLVSMYGLGITIILFPLFMLSWDILFYMVGATEHFLLWLNASFFVLFLLMWLTSSYHIQKCYSIIDIMANTDTKYDMLKQWVSNIYSNNVKLYLYNDANPNAFAVDSGFTQKVYVSIGLLELADDNQVRAVLRSIKLNMDAGITFYQTLMVGMLNAFIYTPYVFVRWFIGQNSISELLMSVFNFVMDGFPLALSVAINREFIKHGDRLFHENSTDLDTVSFCLAIKNSVQNARKYSISREPELLLFMCARHSGLFATHPSVDARMAIIV